jgi:hypothetical protein
MRRILTPLVVLFLGLQLQAQITIERTDFTLEAGQRVTAWHLDYTNASIPEAGENMIWDFSELALSDGFYTDYVAPSNPLFPEANISDPLYLSLLGGLSEREGVSFNLLDETGYGYLGDTTPSTSVSLMPFTGNPQDTLEALSSVRQFSTRKSTIEFPLNYGGSWSYDITSTDDFEVTLQAYNLYNTPAAQITRDSSSYSVAGYGTLILPNPNGLGNVSVEALMVKREREITYNYLLGGQPAPPPMLELFNLIQGEKIQSTRYFFYAKGLPRSAANIRVESNGEITLFTIPDDLKNLISSSSDLTYTEQVRVFPNPAAGGSVLTVEVPSKIHDGTFELLDTYGRSLATYSIDAVQGQHIQCTLPVSLPAGIYAYRIRDHASKIRGTGKLNIVR